MYFSISTKEIRELEAEIIENRANYKADLDMTETAGHALLGKLHCFFQCQLLFSF